MYYVTPITTPEVASGKLFEIQDSLIKISDDSAKRIFNGERGLTEKMLEVSYINGYENPDFHDQWGEDVMEVAYMNEIAYSFLNKNGIVSSDRTVDRLPDNTVGALRVPFYS